MSKPTSFLLGFGFLAVLLLAIPTSFFVYQFHGYSISSDPQKWAFLGSYFSGTVTPIIALLNLGVVTYLATVAHALRKNEEATTQALKTVTEMHKEWNREEMYRAREKAYQFLYANPNQDLKTLEAEKRNDSDLQYVWVVVGFFERLQTLLSFGIVQKDHVAEIFGQIFVWWDAFCFEKKLWDGWTSHGRIACLRKIVSEVKPELIDTWKKQVDAYRPGTEKSA